ESLFSERRMKSQKEPSARAIGCERPATATETTFSGRSSGGHVVSRWPSLLGCRSTSDLVGGSTRVNSSRRSVVFGWCVDGIRVITASEDNTARVWDVLRTSVQE